MKRAWHVLSLLLLPLLIAACAGGDGAAPTAVQGPALIMFYTDN